MSTEHRKKVLDLLYLLAAFGFEHLDGSEHVSLKAKTALANIKEFSFKDPGHMLRMWQDVLPEALQMVRTAPFSTAVGRLVEGSGGLKAFSGGSHGEVLAKLSEMDSKLGLMLPVKKTTKKTTAPPQGGQLQTELEGLRKERKNLKDSKARYKKAATRLRLQVSALENQIRSLGAAPQAPVPEPAPVLATQRRELLEAFSVAGIEHFLPRVVQGAVFKAEFAAPLGIRRLLAGLRDHYGGPKRCVARAHAMGGPSQKYTTWYSWREGRGAVPLKDIPCLLAYLEAEKQILLQNGGWSKTAALAKAQPLSRVSSVTTVVEGPRELDEEAFTLEGIEHMMKPPTPLSVHGGKSAASPCPDEYRQMLAFLKDKYKGDAGVKRESDKVGGPHRKTDTWDNWRTGRNKPPGKTLRQLAWFLDHQKKKFMALGGV